MKRGPGLTLLGSILSRTTLAPCGAGLFHKQGQSEWGGSLLPLDPGHHRPPHFSRHVGDNVIDNGPLHILTRIVRNMFANFCALVVRFRKGGFAIIAIPIGQGYPRKISDIPRFTRMSIVSVHHLTFWIVHVSNQLCQYRGTIVSHPGIISCPECTLFLGLPHLTGYIPGVISPVFTIPHRPSHRNNGHRTPAPQHS